MSSLPIEPPMRPREAANSHSWAQARCLAPVSVVRRGATSGALANLRFVVKDLVDIDGHVPSFGSTRWSETHDPCKSTAPLVTAMLRAGADLVGLVKLDQMAYSLIGDLAESDQPINFSDRDLYCGGSSSGSASAVSAGLADIAIGTDTAGSTRVPAVSCGLYGLRPTHGTIDVRGVTPVAPSFDVVGLLGSRVLAMQATLRQLAPDLDDMASLRCINLGVGANPVGVCDQIASAFVESVGNAFAVPTGRTNVSELMSADAGDLLVRMIGRETWSCHGDWVLRHGNFLAPETVRRFKQAQLVHGDSRARTAADESHRQEITDRANGLITRGKIVVVPVTVSSGLAITASPAQRQSSWTSLLRGNAMSSLSGLPEMVVPIGARKALRLLGARGQDHIVLQVAEALQRLSPAIVE